MIIGIPKEVKVHEYRVGATPEMVRILVDCGHKVLVETNAGSKISFSDDDYKASGAIIVDDPKKIYDCEMVIKVKEPQEKEFAMMHEGLILFCYLHLAPDLIQTKHLLEKKVVGIAYETVVDKARRLPLLTPMSEIAGRISIQVGATALQLNQGGKGLLLGGVPGVAPANVVIIGGGVSGTEAARMAMGLGANVTVLDRDLYRLRQLDAQFGPLLKTLYSTPVAIEKCLIDADLVIGAVLIPGKSAPKLVTKQMIRKMSPGSVVVDLSIDQGGCFETSKPTTHENPTYIVDGVIHYCVTNMPGACARTATLALTHATLGYVIAIANNGYKKAMLNDPGLAEGLNVCLGHVTNIHVAEDLNLKYVSPEQFLGLAQ